MSEHSSKLFIFLRRDAPKIYQKSAPGYFSGACGYGSDIGGDDRCAIGASGRVKKKRI
jgi:hypothetical protein